MDYTYPFEVASSGGGGGEAQDPFDELLCIANALELGREVSVVLKAMAEDDTLELRAAFGVLTVLEECKHPNYTRIENHHYFILQLEYLDGPTEVVVVPYAVEFSERLISAVGSRGERRVLAILGRPQAGPWGVSDGTLLAVVTPGDPRGIVYDLTTCHVALMATDRWRVSMQLVRPSWAARQFPV
jgi:hypothetical protein